LSASRSERSLNAFPESDGKFRKQFQRGSRGEFDEHADGARRMPVSRVRQPEIKRSQPPFRHHFHATYATDNATPKIPFWQMVFKNIRVYFLGSDDFPREAKMRAARDINSALEAGWPGLEIGERLPIVEIARAHELVDHPARRGRVVVVL
jgi:hypothetical protein